MPTLDSITDIPLVLPEGHTVTDLTWSVAKPWGPIDFPSQEEAEAEALAHPSRIETLSYADRDRGVIPAGSGTVELRVTIHHADGGSTETGLLRYDVHRPRSEP